MKRPPPLPRPLRPLPPAMAQRMAAQQEGEVSWMRWDRWKGQPFQLWPDLALIALWDGLNAREIADMTTPTATELRAILCAMNEGKGVH